MGGALPAAGKPWRGDQYWGGGGERRKAPPTSRNTWRKYCVTDLAPWGDTGFLGGEESREASGQRRCPAYQGRHHKIPETGQTGSWAEGPTKPGTCPYARVFTGPPHPTPRQPLSGDKHAGSRTLGRRQPSGPREEILGPQTLCRVHWPLSSQRSSCPEARSPAAQRPRPSSRRRFGGVPTDDCGRSAQT